MDELPYVCRRCGKGHRKRRSLTNRGYCRDGCGPEVAVEHNRQLVQRSGPGFERWAAAMRRVLGESVTPPPR